MSTTTTLAPTAQAGTTGANDRGRRTVLWVHADHLRADNPAFAAYPDAPAVFVFDTDFLSSARFAFHRLFFIYESVAEIFAERHARGIVCSLRRGRVVDEVLDFARAHDADVIVTTDTLGDRFAEYRDEMSATIRVDALPVPDLVAYDAARVPRRFSAWWREVEGQALGGG